MTTTVKWLLCGLLLCAHINPAKAQDAVQQVRKNLYAQQESWNNGDITGFMEYYWKSDSLKFVSRKEVTRGWQTTFDNYKKHYPNKAAMGTLHFELIEVTQVGPDYVFVVGKWNLERRDPVSGHFTLMWRRVANKWVIVTDHTS